MRLLLMRSHRSRLFGMHREEHGAADLLDPIGQVVCPDNQPWHLFGSHRHVFIPSERLDIVGRVEMNGSLGVHERAIEMLVNPSPDITAPPAQPTLAWAADQRPTIFDLLHHLGL